MEILTKKDVMRAFRATLGLLLASVASPALVDWHVGKTAQLGFGYDGLTVAVQIPAWSRFTLLLAVAQSDAPDAEPCVRVTVA